MATKNQLEYFNKKVEAILFDFKATKTDTGHYRYILPTKAGSLHFTVHEAQRTTVYSVYGKFSNLGEAKKVMEENENFNPVTGKFNLHSMDCELLLTELKENLLQIT